MAYLNFILIITGVFSFVIIILVAGAYRQTVLENESSLEVEGGEVKSRHQDRKHSRIFGSPNRLVVHPGEVVVLHRQGHITRAVGAGLVKLKRDEKIKVILPLSGKMNVQKISNVLTQDRIPLDLTVLYVTQIESSTETKARLQQAITNADVHLRTVGSSRKDEVIAKVRLENTKQQLQMLEYDEIIGDNYNQCYESIAKLVAAQIPSLWDGLKNLVAVHIKDLFMHQYSDELFDMRRFNESLAFKIKGIEKEISEHIVATELGKGIVLRNIYINDICFPDEIIAAWIESNIKIESARVGEKTATYDAKAMVIRARAKAQAKMLEGRGDGEARAAFFRELLRELKREETLQGEPLANAVVALIGRMVSAKEMGDFARMASIAVPSQMTARQIEKINGKSES